MNSEFFGSAEVDLVKLNKIKKNKAFKKVRNFFLKGSFLLLNLTYFISLFYFLFSGVDFSIKGQEEVINELNFNLAVILCIVGPLFYFLLFVAFKLIFKKKKFLSLKRDYEPFNVS